MTAKSDRWLPFLWFSQIHQYSKEQVGFVVYKQTLKQSI